MGGGNQIFDGNGNKYILATAQLTHIEIIVLVYRPHVMGYLVGAAVQNIWLKRNDMCVTGRIRQCLMRVIDLQAVAARQFGKVHPVLVGEIYIHSNYIAGIRKRERHGKHVLPGDSIFV